MSGPTPAAGALPLLEAQLQAFAGALDRDDYPQASAVLDAHDASLSALDLHGLDAQQLARVRDLVQAQQALLQRMGSLRDAARAHIQIGHQSLRAAHAYLSAESLA